MSLLTWRSTLSQLRSNSECNTHYLIKCCLGPPQGGFFVGANYISKVIDTSASKAELG